MCAGGICQCVSGYTLCGNECVDPQGDANNCGGCGMKCTGGQVCNAGCTCLPVSDLNACGGCKTECEFPGGVCMGTACVCPGTAPIMCNGSCFDAATSLTNCGACGNACITV